MASEQLWLNAEDHHAEKLGEEIEDDWAISVFSAAGLSAAEICAGAGIPHPKVRLSTVGAVRAIGFDVIPTVDDDLHADLKLDGEPDEAIWELLRSAFSEPQPNPGREDDNA